MRTPSSTKGRRGHLSDPAGAGGSLGGGSRCTHKHASELYVSSKSAPKDTVPKESKGVLMGWVDEKERERARQKEVDRERRLQVSPPVHSVTSAINQIKLYKLRPYRQGVVFIEPFTFNHFFGCMDRTVRLDGTV